MSLGQQDSQALVARLVQQERQVCFQPTDGKQKYVMVLPGIHEGHVHVALLSDLGTAL